jgi:dihydrofolate reductase
MKIASIVAVGQQNEIGANNDLLWRLPLDLQHFKDITWGHHVLMGRKSYEALPPKFRPLAGRVNIIVSRDPSLKIEGCKTVTTIEEGVAFARECGEQELMILGGGEIYKQTMPILDTIYLTRVHGSFPHADTHFPAIDEQVWEAVSTEAHAADEKHKYAFDFIEYRRK